MKLNTYRVISDLPENVRFIGLIPDLSTGFETVQASRDAIRKFILDVVPTIKGDDGKPVELQANTTHIQWRYQGDLVWIDLIPLSSIKGDQGDPGIPVLMRTTTTHIEYTYEDSDNWVELIALADLKGVPGDPGTGLTNRDAWVTGTSYLPGDYVFAEGSTTASSMWILRGSVAYVSVTEPKLDLDHWVEFQAPAGQAGADGRTVEIRKGSTHIQWHWVTGIDQTWKDIVSLAELTGANGKSAEWQKSATHLQWRLQGDTDWINIVALTEIKGADGVGIPVGGAVGYVLAKETLSDYSVHWIPPPSGGSGGNLPTGGVAGQVLTKQSGTNYDAAWVDPSLSPGVTYVQKVAGLSPDVSGNVLTASLKTTLGINDKVDKVAGKGLSSEDFTTAEKTKLSSLESSHFKGVFPTLSSLQSSVTSPVAGDYADVDDVGVDSVRYNWDSSDSKWVRGSALEPLTAAQVKALYEANPDTYAFTGTLQTKLSGIANGATANQTDTYLLNRSNHTGTQLANTISNFNGAAVGSALTGYTVATAASAVVATDTILTAFGKVQYSLNNALLKTGIQKMVSGVFDPSDPVTIASATTIDISVALSEIIFISGNEWIGGLGSTILGAKRTLVFTGAASLAHSNAIQIPGEVNFTAHAGDTVEVLGTALGSWKVINIQRYAAPHQVARLTADVTTTSVTLSDITGLKLNVQANSQYRFEAYVSFITAAASTGFNLGWAGPADCDCLGEIVVPVGNTASATALRNSFQSSSANVLGNTTTSGQLHVGRVSGILTTFTAGEFKLTFASEVASSAANAKAGSILTLTKLD